MLKTSLVFTVVAIGILLLAIIPSQYIFNAPEFQQSISTYLPKGIVGAFCLFAVLSLLTSIGLPRQIGAFISGYSFDVILGCIIATAAATAGCYLTLTLSAKYFYQFIHRKYPQPQQKLQTFFNQQLFYKAIIIRILPVGNNFLTNVIAGSCRIKRTPYIAGSCLGFIPQMLIFSLAGTGVKLSSNSHLIFSGVLFLLALLLSYWLYKKSVRLDLTRIRP